MFARDGRCRIQVGGGLGERDGMTQERHLTVDFVYDLLCKLQVLNLGIGKDFVHGVDRATRKIGSV